MTAVQVLDRARHHVRVQALKAADHALDRVGIAIGNQIFRRTVEKYPETTQQLIDGLPEFIAQVPEIVTTLIDMMINAVVDAANPPPPPPTGGFRWASE